MYYITVSNGLLEGDHQARMGNAVWLFMWFIDKVTRIDSQGWGWVLGGKPINIKDIPFLTRRTFQRYLSTLKNEGYIEVKYTMRGFIVKVAKAKKRFGRDVTKVAHLDVPNVAHYDTKSGAPLVKSGAPNKTVQYDSTVDTTPKGVGVSYQPVNDDGLEVRKVNGLKHPVSDRGAFDYQAELAKMRRLSKPYKIVAHYFTAKGFYFENWEQYYPELSRALKTAKELKGFSGRQVQNAIDHCKKEWGDNWTLETISRWAPQVNLR